MESGTELPAVINKIDGESRTIRELLVKKYAVDYYQREYRWEQKHIEALIQDLESRFLQSYQAGEPRSAVRDYPHYFLGPIVVSRHGNRHFLIDGQQRLTSLTLLLVYLGRLQEESGGDSIDLSELIHSEQYGERSFNLDVEERRACMNALVSGTPYEPLESHGSVATLLARYGDIENLFPDDLKGEALPYFIDWLRDNVELVEIVTYNDEDAYAIFETMNDRGLRLNSTEMLKAYLLSKVGDEELTARANDLWRARMTELEEIGSDEHAEFFKAWLRAQWAQRIRERRRNSTNEDFEQIGSEYHKWVRDHRADLGLERAEDFRQFIERRFKRFSGWYMQIRQAESELTPGLEYIFYNARNNFTLQPALLLAPLCLDDDPGTVHRKLRLVAGYIDIFVFRRIVNFRTLGYSAIVYTMFNVMKEIRGLDVHALVDTLEAKVAELDADEDARHDAIKDLRVHQQNRARVHGILARMTRHLEEKCGVESSFSTYMSRQIRDPFEVEHIWADKPERHIDEFDDERDFRDYRDRLGGLLLLPRSFNQSYGAMPYVDKYEHYRAQNLLARALHEKCYENNPKFIQYVEESGLPFKPQPPPFTKADVDSRQTLYADLSAEIWSAERFRLELGEPVP